MFSKYMSLIGGIILLISWATQNFFYNLWNDRISALKQAELVYSTILATTFTLDAIQALPGGGNNQVLWWTEETFRLGLDGMARALKESDQKLWRDKISLAKDASELNNIGASLMKEVERQEAVIKYWVQLTRWLFLFAYLFGSFMLIFGQYLK